MTSISKDPNIDKLDDSRRQSQGYLYSRNEEMLVEAYGYSGKLNSIRELYPNIPKAYLDNAAAPLVMSSIPQKFAERLCSRTLVNPHSSGQLGSDTKSMVDSVRIKVLEMLHADPSQYEVVFCANATAGLKLVGEALHASHFAYVVDSHTSLVGLRTLAKSFSVLHRPEELESCRDLQGSVVGWPLQSNFDGSRYPGQKWTQHIRRNGGLSLVDIASYAACEMPHLGELEPDFAVLSFYKIFGLPDLGALIVRKSPQTDRFWQHKRYFGGGTVAALTPSQDFVVRKSTLAEGLEDGTLPFHSILLLDVAIDEFFRVYGDFECISKHVESLATYCYERLRELDMVTIYGQKHHSVVTFMLTKDGVCTMGHNEFVTAAALEDVHLRAGTLCNIGGFTQTVGVTDSELIRNHIQLGKKCNDETSFINGRPTGVIRASFGPYSSREDVDALIAIVRKVGGQKNSSLEHNIWGQSTSASVEKLFIYPIKSCHGVSLASSNVLPEGLMNDRLFCVADLATQSVLSLKRNRNMIFIKPQVVGDRIHIRYEAEPVEHSRLVVQIDCDKWRQCQRAGKLLLNMEPETVAFFSQALGKPCTLAKSVGTSQNMSHQAFDTRESSSFANSSPLLVVTTASSEALGDLDIDVFRPNIVLKTEVPWIEDQWVGITNATIHIDMLGRCRRCNMICVTKSGNTDSFPYLQLCKSRKIDGKLYFGQHATSVNKESSILAVGDIVYPF